MIKYNKIMEVKGFEKAKNLINILQKNGHAAVLAGGCVRDMFLDKLPHDFDIATSATPHQVRSALHCFRTKEVGEAFGVILVKDGDHEFEIATFRTDGEYKDGRRPESIKFSNMSEDARRRDFTINAIFFDPVKELTFDFVEGKKDIENRTIRFVGDARQRIAEDRLRMLRAVRFAVKLGFKIEQDSFDAIKDNADSVLDIAPERIRMELEKILAVGKAKESMELLKETGLLKAILPEVFALIGSEQNPVHHPEGDVFQHTILVMESLNEESFDLQIAGMLHDVGKPATFALEEGKITNHSHEKIGAEITDSILRRFKFSNDSIKRIVSLVEDHMKVHVAESMNKSTLKRLLSKEHIHDLIKLGRADCTSKNSDNGGWKLLEEKIKHWEPEVIKPIPLVNGDDLIKMGFKPGILFKEILGRVSDEQLEGNLLTHEEAITFVKSEFKRN